MSGRWAIITLAVVAAGGAVSGQPAAVKLDKDRFEFRQVEDNKPPPRADLNPEEYRAYNDVLLHARRFPEAELEAAARRDVLFHDLVVETRKDFRFDLIHFEGRLKRLRDVGPTPELAAAGVKSLYEGWVFPPAGDAPLCVLLTELPPGLEPALEYDPGRPVTFAGYSFKLLRYEAADPDPKRRHRLAPLLMAHSLTPLPEPAAGSGDGGMNILVGVVGLVAAVSAVLLGLMAYFRRGDRVHRAAMADRRRRGNPFAAGGPEPEGDP